VPAREISTTAVGVLTVALSSTRWRDALRIISIRPHSMLGDDAARHSIGFRSAPISSETK